MRLLSDASREIKEEKTFGVAGGGSGGRGWRTGNKGRGPCRPLPPGAVSCGEGGVWADGRRGRGPGRPRLRRCGGWRGPVRVRREGVRGEGRERETATGIWTSHVSRNGPRKESVWIKTFWTPARGPPSRVSAPNRCLYSCHGRRRPGTDFHRLPGAKETDVRVRLKA